MRLYYDKAFRLVFGCDTEESREALIELLNLVLGREDDPITKVTIKNPMNLAEIMDGKDIIMDINAETERGEQIDIEMQTGNYKYYLDRVILNLSRLAANSLAKGEDYGRMKKSIVISIIRDIRFRDVEEFHNVVHMALDGTGIIISDKLELHFIELGKISDEINPETASGLELLSLYIKYAGDEDKEDYVEKILSQDCKAVSKAERRLTMVTEEERRRIEDWYREMAEHDRAQMIVDARDEVLEEGRKKGREEGREETISKLTQTVSNLMNNLHIDGVKAMDMLGISEEDRIEIARRMGKA